MLADVRRLPMERRLAAADLIRTVHDFTLPELTWFNSDPCAEHGSLDEGLQAMPPCRRCGIKLRKHQRVGVAWLYTRARGLIADQCGTGKTAQAAALLALLKQAGELDDQRAVIICRPAALADPWLEELQRLLPKLNIQAATGTRKQRVDKYLTPWEIMVIGYQMFVSDAEDFDNFQINTLIVDDVDALRNRSNQTAYRIKRLARRCERVVILSATPLQKQLTELHSVLEPIGGTDVFGTQTAFRRQYVREEPVKIYNKRIGRVTNVRKPVGYKNLDKFIRLVTPMTLRRTPTQIDDVELPVLSPHNIFLDLHPGQKSRYDELRRGVLRIIRLEGSRVKHATAVAQFLYGAQICAGLSTLGEADGPGTSSKLDWIENTLIGGDLDGEKVVIFCQFTNTVETLMARLSRAGVGHVVIWGREPDKAVRAQARHRFWNDPQCRVLIGTAAIEQSLNLQVSRHLINVDQLMNPARMTQLAGRIRRDGSAYRTVYVHNLLTRGTQEEGYMEVLSREQALADHIWGESNQLYEALSPLALLNLIGKAGR